MAAEQHRVVDTSCCIAGGGPAGMMLGYLLARAGVPVLVLEKHPDFLRDFRGDTIHPSTLEVMHELGLLSEFLKLPHQEVRQMNGRIGGVELPMADFSHLPTQCKFIALMPQWDFLDFLAGQARRLPCFSLELGAEAVSLSRDGGTVTGLVAQTAQGPLQVRCKLVVAADGRHSTLRQAAGLEGIQLGAPIDVLWLRLPRGDGDPEQTQGLMDAGRIVVMLNRGDYWQCAYVIPKGGNEQVRALGLQAFRDSLAEVAPHLRQRVGALRSWDEVKLLTVAVDRLRQWSLPGLLCIGDAAHAMSPIGGVGVNLAIQDAVAAANVLAAPLLDDSLTADDLRAVQERREWPTRMTQRLQLLIQNRVIGPVLENRKRPAPPAVLRLMMRWAPLRRIPARLLGLGFRPEHVRLPGAR